MFLQKRSPRYFQKGVEMRKETQSKREVEVNQTQGQNPRDTIDRPSRMNFTKIYWASRKRMTLTKKRRR